jgi:hypothetical protein
MELSLLKMVYVRIVRLQVEHGLQPVELENMLPQVLEHRSILESEIKLEHVR